MPDNSAIEKAKNAIQNNPGTFSKIFALALLTFGVLVVIGAIKNWDWLYSPDDSYHNWYTIGQVSRYLGRGTARVIGFIGGLILIFAGGAWSYAVFFKK